MLVRVSVKWISDLDKIEHSCNLQRPEGQQLPPQGHFHLYNICDYQTFDIYVLLQRPTPP